MNGYKKTLYVVSYTSCFLFVNYISYLYTFENKTRINKIINKK